MQRCLRFLFPVLLLLLQKIVGAQIRESVSFRHFDTRDGLPSTQIQGLFEDSRGYIWSITERGAARFNGYEFEVYTTKNGFPTNNVLLINEDRQGRMWFMCNNGAYCYLEGDSIHPYKGNERIGELLRDKLPGPFYFDEHDTLWVTTFSGIQLFKCYGDSVEEYKPYALKAGEKPTYYLRKVGEKLVTLEVGEVTNDNRISTTDNISYLLDVAGECKLACSVEVEKNKWALAGPGGFVLFDDVGNVSAFFDSSPYLFSTLEHDRSGNLWLTNSNGAYRIRDYTNGPGDSDVFFEGHFITAVLQDKSGNYWFGDRDNGLFFVPSLDVKVYKTGESSKQNKTISIKKFQQGIFYSDAEGKVYELNDHTAQLKTLASVPSGVSLDFTFSAKGNIVFGNKPHIYDVKSGRIKSLNIESTIRKSISLSDGSCAFALADGIAFMDADEQWLPIDKSIFKERCNALYEDQFQALWIGANSGLFLFKENAFTEVDLKLPDDKPRVSDILKWQDYLVISTRNNGLIFYKDERSIVINENNGLLSDMIDCLETDDAGNLWIGCASGLQRMVFQNVEEKKFDSFIVSFQKGLPSNEVNDLMFIGNTLYVATNDGICLIDPDATSLQGTPSAVRIESFLVSDSSFTLSDTLFLLHNQNNIRINFISLNYRTGEHTAYRYRIAGLQDFWVETTNRSAEFWSLPPGSYQYEVSAKNEDGAWGDSQTLYFVISPHFTQTWWFRTLAVLFFAILVIGLFYLFYRVKKRKLVIRAKMIELRQQALNANMNPHFIFNSLNSIQHFIHTDNAEDANEFLADFSKLIRMNLETNMQSIVSLCDEIERLELYLKLERLRFGDKLDYEIELSAGVNCMELLMPPMLLQPYAENALIHGILPKDGQGKIHVGMSMEGDNYSVRIKDNGIGIRQSIAARRKTHESLALRMNEERMSILKELTGKEFAVEITDLSDLKEGDTGTLVCLRLPAEFQLPDEF
jgi:ligand-binding sensor domain-containing protein/cbb3-type cytochrome oxidase subunit 3